MTAFAELSLAPFLWRRLLNLLKMRQREKYLINVHIFLLPLASFALAAVFLSFCDMLCPGKIGRPY